MVDEKQIKQNGRLLSIILPVYNAETYIKQCLDSLLEQDTEQEKYEIICINDGSTDDSLRILEEYAKKYDNIRLIDKQNEGVSVARNLGLEKACGKYVWFVDADDFIKPNCLKMIKVPIENEPDIINFSGYSFYRNLSHEENERLKENKLVGNMHYWGFAGIHIYKSDIIKSNNVFFNKDIKYGEDELFYIDAFEKAEKIISLNNVPLYFYRQHANSTMQKLRYYINKMERVKSIILSMIILKSGVESGQYSKNLPKELLIDRRSLCLYCLARLKRKDARSFILKMKENSLFNDEVDERKFKKQLKKERLKKIKVYIDIGIQKIKKTILKRK